MSSPGCRGRQTLLAEDGGHSEFVSLLKQLHYLVVYVAVGKHRAEILDTFLGIPVITVLKPFLYCSHVHRIFDYCVVVLKKMT